MAVTAALLVKNGNLAGTEYWRSGYEAWSQEVFNGLLSFVLSWTLSYALVHGTLLRTFLITNSSLRLISGLSKLGLEK